MYYYYYIFLSSIFKPIVVSEKYFCYISFLRILHLIILMPKSNCLLHYCYALSALPLQTFHILFCPHKILISRLNVIYHYLLPFVLPTRLSILAVGKSANHAWICATVRPEVRAMQRSGWGHKKKVPGMSSSFRFLFVCKFWSFINTCPEM